MKKQAEHPRIDSFSLQELQARLARAKRHREKLDTVARMLELEKENEELENALAERVPELESEVGLEPPSERLRPLPSSERLASSPLVSRPSSEPAEDEAERPLGWRGERILRVSRIHEAKRLETLIEREARDAAQVQWIRWFVTAILSSIAGYVLLPMHLLHRTSEYAALLPSHSRRWIVRGTASTALGLIAIFCLVMVARALYRRLKARRHLAALADDAERGEVIEEVIDISDLTLVNDLSSDYPAISFDLKGGEELELTDYFGLFHPEDLGDRVLLVRSPRCGIMLELAAADDLQEPIDGEAAS